MLSLSKIITLVGLLAIVWFAFRLLGKVQRERQAALRRNGGNPAKPSRGPDPKAGERKATGADAQEMAKCTVCGVYVAADAARCGTPGCPRLAVYQRCEKSSRQQRVRVRLKKP